MSAHLLAQPGLSVYSSENGLTAMPDIATIRALKSDPFKGYNFVAARADSPLLAGIMQGFAKSAVPR